MAGGFRGGGPVHNAGSSGSYSQPALLKIFGSARGLFSDSDEGKGMILGGLDSRKNAFTALNVAQADDSLELAQSIDRNLRPVLGGSPSDWAFCSSSRFSMRQRLRLALIAEALCAG